MRVSGHGGVQGKSFHAAILATRSRHLMNVIITWACFQRELPIKVAIIAHMTSKLACKVSLHALHAGKTGVVLTQSDYRHLDRGSSCSNTRT